MKPAEKLMERRRHPRYYPDRKNQPEVNFLFNGYNKTSIEVVNISQGGLLGYTSKIEQLGDLNYKKIRDIEIIFPGRLPFHCSGQLLRVYNTRQKNKCFCAVQFDETGIDEHRNQIDVGEKIERSLHPAEEIVIPDQLFMARLETAENYLKIKDAKSGPEVRKKVYDSFDDITSRLTFEEKWWFYEIMDEVKRCEPDYPEGLKQAFIKLCRVGWQQSLKNTRVGIFDK